MEDLISVILATLMLYVCPGVLLFLLTKFTRSRTHVELEKWRYDLLLRTKEQYHRLQKKYDVLEDRYDHLTEAYHYIYDKYQSQPKSQVTFSKDELEMLRFAVRCAHPDAPTGSNERFKKYHEIYKKYK